MTLIFEICVFFLMKYTYLHAHWIKLKKLAYLAFWVGLGGSISIFWILRMESMFDIQVELGVGIRCPNMVNLLSRQYHA